VRGGDSRFVIRSVKPRYHGCERDAGFTLTEALVTLALVTLLLTAGASSLQAILQSNRMTAEVNRFVTALQLGRSEAVKRTLRVTLCPSADGVRCARNSHWHAGWILFVGSDDGAADELLYRGAPFAPGISMQSGRYRRRVVFLPGGSTSGSNSSFTFCDGYGKAAPRVICLSNTGRPRLASSRCDGRPVVCPPGA
jgi:type IV fimbrial biogenesis protein FimT